MVLTTAFVIKILKTVLFSGGLVRSFFFVVATRKLNSSPTIGEKMEEDEIVLTFASQTSRPLGRSNVARKGVGLSVGLMFAAYVHGK